MTLKQLLLGAAATAASVLAFHAPASAQSYPEKTIRIMVPYKAGGLVDTSARLVAAALNESLGQPVVVENKPGGFGMIAVESVTTAEPDGYTLLIDTMGVAMNPSMRKAPYDPLTDLAPVGVVMSLPFAIAANPEKGISTVADFISVAQANPGALNAAVAGTSTQLATALFGLQTETEFEFVNYQGAAPAMTAVLSGEADFIALDFSNLTQHINAGTMDGLLVTLPERSAAAPQVPTAAEAGLPDFTISTWFAIFAPAGTPQDIVDILNENLRGAVKAPELASVLEKRGAVAGTMTAQEFDAFFKDEVVRWAEVVEKAGLKVE
jgi:tripartite-type tricarboxylate transporter receptor subunit TctC